MGSANRAATSVAARNDTVGEIDRGYKTELATSSQGRGSDTAVKATAVAECFVAGDGATRC